MRERTSASQACGSTSLSFAVFAGRRTMPGGRVSASVFHDLAAAGQLDGRIPQPLLTIDFFKSALHGRKDRRPSKWHSVSSAGLTAQAGRTSVRASIASPCDLAPRRRTTRSRERIFTPLPPIGGNCQGRIQASDLPERQGQALRQCRLDVHGLLSRSRIRRYTVSHLTSVLPTASAAGPEFCSQRAPRS